MNDDFLHRIRVEPDVKFLCTLKASLDKQVIRDDKARRSLFRSALLAMLMGGSAMAFAVAALRGLPELGDTLAHISAAVSASWNRNGPNEKTALDPSAPVSNTIISARAGEGAPKADLKRAHDTLPLAAPAPLPTSGEPSHSIFSMAGPTAIIFNAKQVARRPVETGMVKQPEFTVMSTDRAIAMLCHANPDAGFADIAGASRRILASELESCARNGVAHVAELHSGYETIVLARSRLYGAPRLSARDVFLGLAAEVPDPDHRQTLIKNPYFVWSAVNADLPEERIDILGPPSSSATAAAFRQTLMEAGCETFPWLAALKQTNRDRYERVCRTVRGDFVYHEVDSNLVGYLEANPNAMVLFDYGYFSNFPLVAASIDGVEPNSETIIAGTYLGSRAMYLYVNTSRARTVPNMQDFVLWYVRSVVYSGAIPTTLVAPVSEQRKAEMLSAVALHDMKL
jgi:phosphate transport system substrate-binding protein